MTGSQCVLCPQSPTDHPLLKKVSIDYYRQAVSIWFMQSIEQLLKIHIPLPVAMYMFEKSLQFWQGKQQARDRSFYVVKCIMALSTFPHHHLFWLFCKLRSINSIVPKRHRTDCRIFQMTILKIRLWFGMCVLSSDGFYGPTWYIERWIW